MCWSVEVRGIEVNSKPGTLNFELETWNLND